MLIEEINKKLISYFGTHEDLRPMFRVVWSSDQFETRWGTFNKFYGKIYIGSETGVAKDKVKYPWIKDRWILERLTFPSRGYQYWSPELIGVENGSYEIVWKFETKEGEYQYPIWEAVKCVIASLFATKVKLTEKDLDRMEKEQEDKIVEEDTIILRNASPFSGKARVSIDSTKIIGANS